MLTEQVEQGKDRVNLPDDGYLLEFNQRYLRDDEPGFRTKRGSSIAFKDPDEITKKQRRQVRGAVTRFEKVLYGPGFADPKTGYAAYVDVKRIIDWYLVEELFANQDSNFQSSVHFSWVPGKRFIVRPGLGLRPERRHQVARRRARRRAGTPAPASTGSRGCWRTRRSPAG